MRWIVLLIRNIALDLVVSPLREREERRIMEMVELHMCLIREGIRQGLDSPETQKMIRDFVKCRM